MLKSWHDSAWDDYLRWQVEDRKTLRRINSLIKGIERNGYETTGKPELVAAPFHGPWISCG
ncbi:MAG: type II toxin-antitoxin system YoeB family toxin [Bifidobacteriaceae bacterium]|jgi:toxin YoeB|nr:type II toxin-antitoxin system YoeB family toxin [Bifidobacteriaceae bacterium]